LRDHHGASRARHGFERPERTLARSREKAPRREKKQAPPRGRYAEKELYFQSLVFCSLDIVDECVARKANETDMYLGFLLPIDEFQIYGYMTNTNVKFIAIVDDRRRPEEPEWRAFFQKCHTAYVEYLRNPFNPIDAKKIEAPSFVAKVDAAVTTHLETAIAKPPTPITS